MPVDLLLAGKYTHCCMDIKDIASMGGRARARLLTPARRKEIALKAIGKRYNKSYLRASIESETIGSFHRCAVCNTKYCNHDEKSLLYMNIKNHDFIA